jgi:hypothetical protein
LGFTRGCGCRIDRKVNVLAAKCIIGKW